MRIAILHPDLGLGGAERLIVDAAYSLARNVCIYNIQDMVVSCS